MNSTAPRHGALRCPKADLPTDLSEPMNQHVFAAIDLLKMDIERHEFAVVATLTDDNARVKSRFETHIHTTPTVCVVDPCPRASGRRFFWLTFVSSIFGPTVNILYVLEK